MAPSKSPLQGGTLGGRHTLLCSKNGAKFKKAWPAHFAKNTPRVFFSQRPLFNQEAPPQVQQFVRPTQILIVHSDFLQHFTDVMNGMAISPGLLFNDEHQAEVHNLPVLVRLSPYMFIPHHLVFMVQCCSRRLAWMVLTFAPQLYTFLHFNHLPSGLLPYRSTVPNFWLNIFKLDAHNSFRLAF